MPMTESIRILHVIDSLGLGGAQTFLATALQAFDDPRFSFDVCALHGPGVLGEHFEALGSPPIYLAKSKFSPAIPIRLARLIREGDYGIVHAHLTVSCFLCETFRRPFKIQRLVSHVQNVSSPHLHDALGTPAFTDYQTHLEKRIYKATDLVVGCSQAVLDSFSLEPESRVVYNVVDEKRFNPSCRAHCESIRNQWGLSREDFVVGSTGRLAPQKNHVMILHSLARLRETIPNLKILLVGSGPLESTLRKEAESLGLQDRVIFTGFQAEVERCLGAMDVFIMPSHYEGFGNSLVEAMACGIPCISSDFPPVHEIITHCESGLIFKRKDAAGLSRHILTFHQNPQLRSRMARAARAHCIQNFTPDTCTQKLIDVYEHVLEKPVI